MAEKKKPGKCKRILSGVWGCLKAIFCLNIANYFLVSGVVYIACAFVVNIQYGKIETFLCNVWAAKNETGGFGKGCDECGFNAIFCSASECWHDAINLTYKLDLLDKNPNPIMEALLKAPKFAESPTFLDATVDTACNAVLEKYDTPAKAVLMMYTRSIATAAAQQTDPPVSQACATFHCQVLVNALEHPDLMKAPQSDAKSGCTNSEKVKRPWATEKCVCAGLYQELSATDITNIETFCSLSLKTTTTTTITTTTTTTSSTTSEESAVGGIRRLQQEGGLHVHPSQPDLETKVNGSCCGESRPQEVFVDASLHAPTPTPWSSWTPPWVEDVESLVTDLFYSVPIRALATARRLQDPAPSPGPAGLTNDDLQDFEVGDWSKCTCYQQCVSGVMTRSVECLADKCKEPKPPRLQACKCPHCANCQILLNLNVFFYLFIIQGLVAIFVWSNFMWLNHQPEAAFVKASVNFLKKFLGFWVKQLPGAVRLCVLMNMVQIVVAMVQTWVPGSLIEIAPDCNASMDLRVLSIILLGQLTMQIFMGVLTRMTNRMPPFLYRPNRPVHFLPLRVLGGISRFLGP